MQRALDRAGFRRRRKLGPRQIDLEEFVGDEQPAALVAVEQVVAAGEPEVLHLRSPALRSSCASPTRSTCSAGCSSSPSTSRNANARSGFGPPRGRKRAERLADRAVRAAAMHGDQRVVRMIAERAGELDLLRRGGARRGEIGRAAARHERAAPGHRSRCCGPPRLPRRSAPASTSRTTECRGSRRGTRVRALPSSASGSTSENMKVPDTAHSPGSAARSNTNVSDGSSRMVRRSFTARASGCRIEPRRRPRARGSKARRSTSALPMRRTSRSPLSSMSRRTPCSARQARQIVLRDLREALLLPGVDRDHQVAREALDQPAGAGSRRSPRPRARPQAGAAPARRPPSTRCGSCRRTRATAAARLRRLRARRCGRRRPARRRRGWRPASRRRSASRAAHATASASASADMPGIEGAPRGAQRLLRLEHHGELGEIEAADEDEPAGAELGRIGGGVRKRVAHLAQGDEVERRRQIERRPVRRARGASPAAFRLPDLPLPFDWYN